MATSCSQGRRPALLSMVVEEHPNPAVSSADQCDGSASPASKSSDGVWPHTISRHPLCSLALSLSRFSLFPKPDIHTGRSDRYSCIKHSGASTCFQDGSIFFKRGMPSELVNQNFMIAILMIRWQT